MTEHAASIFVFFFLAEYASILLMSILTSILFIGGYIYPYIPSSLLLGIAFELETMTFDSYQAETLQLVNMWNSFMENPIFAGLIFGSILGIKTSIIVFCFIWVRASFPRIRYDQLMTFC
jgi:NADH-ubiquinone oxidoreductase chain 1